MKTKNSIIVKTEKSMNAINSWDLLSDESLTILCDSVPARMDGAIVVIETAEAAIESYKIKVPNDDVRAFHIGLDHLKKMVEKADEYNSQSGVPDPIVGYRFYKAITTRGFGNEPINDKRDLVAVATSKDDDGETIHQKSYNGITVPLFTHFRPCPRICGKKK